VGKIWKDSLFIHEVWFANIFDETNISEMLQFKFLISKLITLPQPRSLLQFDLITATEPLADLTLPHPWSLLRI
jgi:hypothetical protein